MLCLSFLSMGMRIVAPGALKCSLGGESKEAFWKGTGPSSDTHNAAWF